MESTIAWATFGKDVRQQVIRLSLNKNFNGTELEKVALLPKLLKKL